MNPKVSIITPLHNKGQYIRETIESVRSQSFADWEMIVVENGSTDEGPRIAGECADERVRLVVSAKQGPGVARNLGIRESRGEWIQFLDADDLLLPGHLQSMSEAAESAPDADLITCDWLEGSKLREGACERKQPTNRPGRKNWKKSAIAFTPWVVHAAWSKRNIIATSGWWDESYDRFTFEDHVFWFRLILMSRSAVYAPHLGVFYRLQTGSGRHDTADIASHLRTVDRAIQSNLESLAASGKTLEYEHRRSLLNAYLELGLALPDDSQLVEHLRARVREYRPSLAEAIKRRDFSSAASFFFPPTALAWSQRKWRTLVGGAPARKDEADKHHKDHSPASAPGCHVAR